MALYDKEYILKALKNEYSYDVKKKITVGESILVGFLNLFLYLGFSIIYVLSKIPLISSIMETISRTFSRDAIGFFLRGSYYKAKLKKMGKNVLIDVGAIIWNPECIQIGDNTHIDTYVKVEAGKAYGGSVKIGKYCHIGNKACLHGGGKLIIGNYVGIATDARVYSASNFPEDPKNPERFVNMSVMAPASQQYVLKKPVIIEDYAWVGMGAIILPGVRIGKGAVVGACSIVNKDVPPYAVVLGMPARVVKKRAEKKN